MIDKYWVDIIFIQLYNMSVSAGWLILAVIVLRLFMRKAPRWICCVLWAMVAVRLVCPVSLESIFSLVPSAETISYEREIMPEITSGVPFVDNTLNPMIESTINGPLDHHIQDAITPPASPLISWIHLAGIVWAAGFAVLLTIAFLGYLRVRRMLREAVLWQDNIWFCDQVKSPFILGIFKPGIYLPSNIGQEQIGYVLAHEQAHLRRRDHLWKVLGYLLRAVYWFHPLVWVAFILLCRDIEVACDEKVIRNLDMGERKAYSRALLSCSQQRRMVIAYPLAFGEVGVKDRVRSVLRYKKPAFWAAGAAIAACVVVAVCFLTNPEQPAEAASVLPIDLDRSGTDNSVLSGADTNDVFWVGDINSAETDNNVLTATEIENRPEAGEGTGSGTDANDPAAEDVGSLETQTPDSMGIPASNSPEPQNIVSPRVSTGYPEYDALIAEAQDVLENFDPLTDESGNHFSGVIYRNQDYEILGYILRDLDGNGVEELIFGENGENGWDGIVYDLYTIVDGQVVHIFDGWERNRYYLCENGCIANEAAYSGFEFSYAYYAYSGTELALIEAVIYCNARYVEDRDQRFYSTVYAGLLDEYEYEYGEKPAPEVYYEITEEKAEEILAKYVYEHPQFTPFVEP